MRIIGIDPGFERVGIAVLEKEKNGDVLLYSNCFKTLSSLPFHERLALIGEEIKKIVKKYNPDTLAIETLFFNTNQKTAFLVSEARGVVLYEAVLGNLKIYEYTPLQIKIAITGYGRADKKQINNMVRQLIVLKEDIKSDDEMDAVATAITCSASYRA